MKYDKNLAKALNSKYTAVSNVTRMVYFSSAINHGLLTNVAKIAKFVKAGESHSKATINRMALQNINDTSYVAMYSFLSVNKILTYSAKTRQWTQGDNYNQFMTDIDSCISKKYKIEVLKSVN